MPLFHRYDRIPARRADLPTTAHKTASEVLITRRDPETGEVIETILTPAYEPHEEAEIVGSAWSRMRLGTRSTVSEYLDLDSDIMEE